MALEFVTSKQGKAHISSSDWRSLNRGNFGRGKYILEDTQNNSTNDFTVSATQGRITIPPRSFIWSGAHIRNTASTVVEYVPPTVSSTVSVWLHYTKDANSGIEDLEFVVTVDSQPSPIIDEIEDSTLEAYTLIFSFLHNVESTTADNASVDFQPLKSLDSLNNVAEITAQALVAEQKERQAADEAFNSRLETAEDNIGFIKGGIEVLAQNLKVYPTQTGSRIFTSTTPLSRYRLIVLLRHSRTAYNDYRTPLVIPAREGVYIHSQLFIDDVGLTDATKTDEINMNVEIDETTSGFTISHSSVVTSSYSHYNELDYYDIILGIY